MSSDAAYSVTACALEGLKNLHDPFIINDRIMHPLNQSYGLSFFCYTS